MAIVKFNPFDVNYPDNRRIHHLDPDPLLLDHIRLLPDPDQLYLAIIDPVDNLCVEPMGLCVPIRILVSVNYIPVSKTMKSVEMLIGSVHVSIISTVRSRLHEPILLQSRRQAVFA